MLQYTHQPQGGIIMRTKRRIPFLNFKTGFRLTVLSFWGIGLFKEPLILILLVPYLILRLMALMENYTKYDEWKNDMYAKSDQGFTVRKLEYLIRHAYKLSLRNSHYYHSVFGEEKNAYVYLDEHIKITLKKDEDSLRHTVSLCFDQKLVNKVKAFKFQKISWKLKEFPELERVLSKQLHALELEIEALKKNAKKEKSKEEKRAMEQEKQYKESLAKEIRNTYKKEMDL